MKKFIIVLLALLSILLAFAYFKLFRGQSTYYKAIAATDNSVLILNNFDLGDIKVVTGKTDVISFDLEGDPEALAAVEYENDGLFTQFGISSDWTGVNGTIVVPEGTLLDVTLSGESSVVIKDVDGENTVETDSFLVDTSELTVFEGGLNGQFILEGWGELTVWDDEDWGDVNDETESGSESSNDEPVYCGVGSQAIRDYCCMIEHEADEPPFCDGVGHWIFDNVARDCAYNCEDIDVGEISDEEPADCSVGGQSERNACCAEGHEGEYQGCIGDWVFDNSGQACAFKCDDPGAPGDPGGEGEGEGEPESYDDPVSNFCANINDAEDKDLCCNDALKNDLSTGPRPGFPDCIGTWYFDGDSGCEFQCADRAEMLKILNEIKQNLQNQEE